MVPLADGWEKGRSIGFGVWLTSIVKYGFSCLWYTAVLTVAVTDALILSFISFCRAHNIESRTSQ